jgi:hypothetical protein
LVDSESSTSPALNMIYSYNFVCRNAARGRVKLGGRHVEFIGSRQIGNWVDIQIGRQVGRLEGSHLDSKVT